MEGCLSPEQWHQHLSRRLGRGISFQEFCGAWNQALREPLLDEGLFAGLTPRYRLLLLSNTNLIHVDYMEEAYGFLQYFPIRLFSHTLGASKPAEVVYKRAISSAGVEPERILYIDDIPAYVEAGRRAGLQGYRFQEPAALLAELKTRGILV